MGTNERTKIDRAADELAQIDRHLLQLGPGGMANPAALVAAYQRNATALILAHVRELSDRVAGVERAQTTEANDRADAAGRLADAVRRLDELDGTRPRD